MLPFLLGRLRWPPDAVWRATPREVAAAFRPLTSAAPMGADELAALIRAHPDPTRTHLTDG